MSKENFNIVNLLKTYGIDSELLEEIIKDSNKIRKDINNNKIARKRTDSDIYLDLFESNENDNAYIEMFSKINERRVEQEKERTNISVVRIKENKSPTNSVIVVNSFRNNSVFFPGY